MHRLVQQVTRHQLDPEQARAWAGVALRLIRAAFPDRLGDSTAWPQYAELLPHALAVIDHVSTHGIQPEATTWLLREAAAYLWQRADHEQARVLLERALAIREARLGPDYPDTAQSLNNLAAVLRDQGDLDTARPLYERAFSICEARLGPDHPDTVQSRERLARIVAALENRQ